MQTPSSSSSGPPQLESGPPNSSSEDHDASLIVISEREFRELCPNGVGSEPIGPGTWVHNGVTIGPGKGGIFGHFGKGGNAGGKRGPRAKYDHAEYWAHSPIGPNLKPFCPDPIQAYYNLWHKLPPGVEKTPEELNQYRSSVPQPTWKKPCDFRIRGPLPPQPQVFSASAAYSGQVPNDEAHHKGLEYHVDMQEIVHDGTEEIGDW